MDFPFTHLMIAILLSRPSGGPAAVTPSPISLQCPMPEAAVGTQRGRDSPPAQGLLSPPTSHGEHTQSVFCTDNMLGDNPQLCFSAL